MSPKEVTNDQAFTGLFVPAYLPLLNVSLALGTPFKSAADGLVDHEEDFSRG